MSADLRRTVAEFPEVIYAVTHLGRNDDGTDPWTPSHVEAAVVLAPYDSWPNGGSKQDLVRRMKARLEQLPGFEIAMSQPIIDSVLDKVFDPHSALAVKIFGDDFNELQAERFDGPDARCRRIAALQRLGQTLVDRIDADAYRCPLGVDGGQQAIGEISGFCFAHAGFLCCGSGKTLYPSLPSLQRSWCG